MRYRGTHKGIFICTFDPFGRGLYQYTYQPVCQESGERLDDGTSRIFLNTKGSNDLDVRPELVAFLRFLENSEAWKDVPEDELLQKMHKRITYLKRSRRLEERYMLFGEMLDDERREGRQEGLNQMIRLIEAMDTDGRVKEVVRLTSEPDFLAEMLECYGLASEQAII